MTSSQLFTQTTAVFSHFLFLFPRHTYYTVYCSDREGEIVLSVSLGASLSTALYSGSEIHVATCCLSCWIIHLGCVRYNVMLLFTCCYTARIWFNFKDRFRHTDAPPLTYYPSIYHSITPMFYVSREQVYTHCISPVLCALPPPPHCVFQMESSWQVQSLSPRLAQRISSWTRVLK